MSAPRLEIAPDAETGEAGVTAEQDGTTLAPELATSRREHAGEASTAHGTPALDASPWIDTGPSTPEELPRDTQPLGVYAQWLVLGIAFGTAALYLPLGALVRALAERFPDGSHVATFAALALLALTAMERSKRDRAALGALFLASVAVCLVVAVAAPGALAGYGTLDVWLAALFITGYGVFHLTCLEDWIDGKAGARTQKLIATAQDLATLRWWAWSSKVARLRRARNEELRSELARARAEEEAVRRRAEDEAARAEADRRAAEHRIAEAHATQEASEAERRATRERSLADEEARKAAEVATQRALAESKVASARKRAEESKRAAEAAVLSRTQLRGEYLAATQRVLETAMSAKAVAERALSQEVEAERARELLEAALEELKAHADTEEYERLEREYSEKLDRTERGVGS